MAENAGAKNWFEWAVFAVGLLLTVGTVGLLASELVSQGERAPATIEVRLGEAEKRGDHFAVPVVVENVGDETAESVEIEATLKVPDSAEEKAKFQVQFLPGRGKREGVVLFQTDPASGVVDARAVGYQKP